jgi:prephenate dehydrogenase
MTTHHIGIIGFGRFGKVIHRLFSDGFDIRVNSSRVAEGVVDGVVFDTLEQVVKTADAVFLTVPISKTGETATRIRPYLKPGQVVVDVCSVKETPNNALEEALDGTGATIWPTHPMFGPDSTRSGFDGLVWVTCEAHLDPAAIAPYRTYLEQKGLTLMAITCEAHDRMAARSQGLTHFIGRFLDELDIRPTPIDTLGYKRLLAVRDQTCNDTWELFCDLQRFNRFSREIHQALLDAISKVLSRFLDTAARRNTPILGVLESEQTTALQLWDAHMGGVSTTANSDVMHTLFSSVDALLHALSFGDLDAGVFRLTRQGAPDIAVARAMGESTFEVVDLVRDEAGETVALVKRRRWQHRNAPQ